MAKRIRITQGSGYYDIKAHPSGIVEIHFDEGTRELLLMPKMIGRTRVSVLDRCLTNEASIMTATVVSIGRIEIEAPDLVEKSKSIEAIVKLFDSNDNLIEIDHENMAIYELSEDVLDTNVLSVKVQHKNNLNEGEVRFVITGVELGETKIVVTSGIKNGDGKRVSSKPVTIQVNYFFVVYVLLLLFVLYILFCIDHIFFQSLYSTTENFVIQNFDKLKLFN